MADGGRMKLQRPLLITASEYDVAELREQWKWLVPDVDTPLFISAFGDWVFGRPDGSLWVLSLLGGTYEEVARNATEYNTLNKQVEWVEHVFIASWQPIAEAHGMVPETNECLGWRLHPCFGGKLEVANLQIFSMRVYQSIIGQLHRNIQKHGASAPMSVPRIPRDFRMRSEADQKWLQKNTWCGSCDAADLGMRNPREYEENGVIYVEGDCGKCGGAVRSSIEEVVSAAQPGSSA